jgi:hypothetical protein
VEVVRLQRFFAFLLAVSLPAWAAPAAAQTAAASETLTIGFAPPLDTDLAYRLTMTKPSEGGTDTSTVDQALRFVRDGDGFILTITPRKLTKGSFSLDLATQRHLLPPPMRPLFEPVRYEVDASGEVLRIRDWQAVVAKTAAGMDTIATTEPDPAKREQLKAIGRSIVEMYGNMTAEQAAPYFLQGWQAMLGFGGSEAPSGERQHAEGEIDAGFAPVAIPVAGDYVFSRPAPGTVRLVQAMEVDPIKLAETLNAFVAQMAESETVDANARAGLEEATAKIRSAKISDGLEIDFDAVTGLPNKGKATRTMTLPGEPTAVQTTVIERVR